MRTSPVNYIVALTLAGVLWAICGVPLGNYLADSISLAQATTVDFVRVFRVTLAIAALVGFAGCAHWFFYGSREKTAGDMPGARRTWNVWFFVELIACVGAVAGVVLSFADESFIARDYLLLVISSSLLTWVLFWVASLLLSPRGVMYCMLGRR
ncbi:MAG: hypothetical protein IPJ17_12915 [Holophagales bacterium]|nr:MAG: hypothetical protein IPJ17_12915 [Holophagales bacterium]